MDQNINDSKSHIWNSFFESVILGIQFFNVRPHVPVDIIRDILNYRFSSRKSQSQQKLVEKITDFTIKFHSKNLLHFTNLNSLDIENNQTTQHNTTKNLPHFTNFPPNSFLFCVRKNICTALFLAAQELHSRSILKCLYISIYLHKKIFAPKT